MPTGIDRVCLAYVRHYATRAQAVVMIGERRRILSVAASDALFEMLLYPRRDFRGSLVRLALRHARSVAYGEPGRRRLYLNVGHTGLDRPGVASWIERVAVRPVYMVHDLIPLTHPEYCRPGEAIRHAARITTMLDTARGIIANSQTTLEILANWAQATGRPMPPARIAWLGTEELGPGAAAPPIADPYFVVLGTIEGRKNHLLLLHVWRAMAEHPGSRIPKLVIIGQRGWEAAQVTALLDRCAALRGHVIELPDCDDVALATWLRHARALLFPSFAEGYGMPLTEALAAGIPVIASDLAVFRELASDLPTYLDPTDGPGWAAAIRNVGNPPTGYPAPTWPQHFATIDRWLELL